MAKPNDLARLFKATDVFLNKFREQADLVSAIRLATFWLREGGILSVPESQKIESISPKSENDRLFVVRKLTETDHVYSGDLVCLPSRAFGRVIASGGDVLESTISEQQPITLDPREVWVVCENSVLTDESGAYLDSRHFGPIPVKDLLGRAVYEVKKLENGVPTDHGAVKNSTNASSSDDFFIKLEIEDVLKEITKRNK